MTLESCARKFTVIMSTARDTSDLPPSLTQGPAGHTPDDRGDRDGTGRGVVEGPDRTRGPWIKDRTIWVSTQGRPGRAVSGCEKDLAPCPLNDGGSSVIYSEVDGSRVRKGSLEPEVVWFGVTSSPRVSGPLSLGTSTCPGPVELRDLHLSGPRVSSGGSCPEPVPTISN